MNLRQVFLQHVAQTSDMPLSLEIERASGMYLYTPQGKRYMDLIAGIGVSSLGHCHPAVVAAVQQQAGQYMHTMVYGEYVLAPQVQLAQALANALPAPLDTVYFVNSGTEATEGAMKLAKRYTGRAEIIACRKAYHGSTQGAASLMSPTDFTQGYHPLLPGVQHIEFNCLVCLERITNRTAAVFVEPVQAEWGVRTAQPGYLEALRKRCTETGTLLVFDEIQTGYGRTGTLWGMQHSGVVPDVVLLAKGMGGGMPIGAFVASGSVMQVLSHTPVLGHITTFGGHPVSVAAALATLQTLQETALVEEVEAKGALFESLLCSHPHIQEIRRAGLLMALQLDTFDAVRQTILYCLEQGLVVDWFLFNERSIRIAPPLIIGEEEIRWACRVLRDGLDSL